MHIDIISIFPDLLKSPFEHSIMKRAQQKGIVTISLINLRDFAVSKHKNLDDYCYGGGAGMVMMIEPVANCINYLKSKYTYDEIIYMSPDGQKLNQKMANNLSILKRVLILCGHYKGIDERIRELFITQEISVGDYVLSGGELAAAVLSDSVIRLIPGVLNDETSALSDSFQDDLLSPPVYTRPANFNGLKVPEVLLSGHAAEIEKWRYEQAYLRTKLKRPDLLNH